MRHIKTDDDIRKGLAHLAAADPRMRAIIDRAGPVPLRRSEPGFGGLCRIIISQQVSVASARAIGLRLAGRYPALSHHDILQASDEDLRSCGLSGPKIRTLRAIAEAADDGILDLDALNSATPDIIRAGLTRVKGIGPWTADIYLMFHLGHADVFAPGDLALQEAARLGFGLDARPTATELGALAERWSPWRAVAARLLWAYYAAVKTRDGVNA